MLNDERKARPLSVVGCPLHVAGERVANDLDRTTDR
jgi:hypothetical protein